MSSLLFFSASQKLEIVLRDCTQTETDICHVLWEWTKFYMFVIVFKMKKDKKSVLSFWLTLKLNVDDNILLFAIIKALTYVLKVIITLKTKAYCFVVILQLYI